MKNYDHIIKILIKEKIIYTTKDSSAVKEMKACHLQQHDCT